MSDRSTFKESVRLLANVLDAKGPDETIPAVPSRDALSRAKSKVPADEANAAPPRIVRSRKPRPPKGLEWLRKQQNLRQVTVELPPELHRMVTRASHGQQMNAKHPGTIREIYSVAAVEWLERNGWFASQEVVDGDSAEEDRSDEVS